MSVNGDTSTSDVAQSLFSTQGVTLTDLQEAEKTIKTEQKEREKKKEEDERDTKQKKADEGVRAHDK